MAPVVPLALEGSECGVCGMTVADQPSPRAQVAHRGGEHRFFCSVGDLLHYLAAPGPLGAPEGLWVEVLPSDLDPAAHDTAPRPWAAPYDLTFVIGVERRVMGLPALSYETRTEAEAAAVRLDGALAAWSDLFPPTSL